MFDRAILAGCVHRLKNQQHGPLVLGVEFVLQFGQSRDAIRERLFRSWLVCFLGEFKRIVRTDIFETKIPAFADAEWLARSCATLMISFVFML